MRSRSSHRQFRHPTRPGRVTVPMHGSRDLGIELVRAIDRQSGLKIWR
ncbi:MAG TPA: type II toxin-antitoxin system HicA family toxin [Stellaceae bacterium]|nr:type II toxin-antitoxin system HicA family toxin [Stellaceae bacterium]